MHATIFGPQRSGTNFLESLLKDNFEDVKIRNQDSNYVWKHCAYPEKFKGKLTDNDSINIVIHKNPYKWLESLMRYNADLDNRYGGKREEYKDLYKVVQEGDITVQDKRGKNTNLGGACRLYNDFYHNWENFKGVDVMWVRYEDLLVEESRARILQQIQNKYKLRKKKGGWAVPKKVGQSDQWTDQRQQDYLNMSNFDKLEQRHIDLVNKYIDNKLLEKFNYPIISEKGWNINKRRN